MLCFFFSFGPKKPWTRLADPLRTYKPSHEPGGHSFGTQPGPPGIVLGMALGLEGGTFISVSAREGGGDRDSVAGHRGILIYLAPRGGGKFYRDPVVFETRPFIKTPGPREIYLVKERPAQLRHWGSGDAPTISTMLIVKNHTTNKPGQ